MPRPTFATRAGPPACPATPAASGYDVTKVAWANFGSCFLGTILASLIGLPLVLLHVGALDTTSFALWMGSTAVTIAASVFYWLARAKKE